MSEATLNGDPVARCAVPAAGPRLLADIGGTHARFALETARGEIGDVPRLGARFDASPFRARFEAKGRFAGYLARIPTFVITAPHPAFTGVSRLLARALSEAG